MHEVRNHINNVNNKYAKQNRKMGKQVFKLHDTKALDDLNLQDVGEGGRPQSRTSNAKGFERKGSIYKNRLGIGRKKSVVFKAGNGPR